MKRGFAFRRARALTPAGLALFLVLVPLVCSAEKQAGTGRLAEIRITGSTRFTSEQIAAATGLHVGAQVGRDDFQRAADNLAKTGRFSNVQYRYGDSDQGVRVEYQVTDAPSLPVWFDNFPWFTDEELIQALKASVPLFDGTAPEGGSVLDDISDALQLQIAKAGVHTTVSHVLTTSPGSDEHVQQFRVDEGGLVVASIDFGDALAQNDRGIHSRLPDLVGMKYSRAALALFELEQVRPVYLSHGFLRVRFLPPAAKVVGTSVQLAAPIDPGPAFTWRVPTWTGNTVLGSLELATLVPLHDGDIADGTKIERGWQAVEDAYARHGYLDVNLSTVPHFDDGAKTVAYSVSITEGPQYHMGKLVLTGLSTEGEKRIRAAWKMAQGDVFDRAVYEEFILNGIREAFAGMPFHYEKIGRFLQKDSSNATVDVLIDFQ
jgi:outer membrane protein assembly factor BamA